MRPTPVANVPNGIGGDARESIGSPAGPQYEHVVFAQKGTRVLVIDSFQFGTPADTEFSRQLAAQQYEDL
jgi:hypothetical protein